MGWKLEILPFEVSDAVGKREKPESNIKEHQERNKGRKAKKSGSRNRSKQGR